MISFVYRTPNKTKPKLTDSENILVAARGEGWGAWVKGVRWLKKKKFEKSPKFVKSYKLTDLRR